MKLLCGPNIPRVVSSDGEAKRAILQRLKVYRAANGPGCLDAVAKAARSPKTITAMVLRDVLLGSAVLEMKDWLKIGRALDKLEATARKEEVDG